MNKEPLSTSTQEVPKLKTALLDKIVTEKKPEKDLSKTEDSKLPQPTGWRLLVLPFKMKERTNGGLYLGQETLERQQVGSNCGMVLKMGAHVMIKKDILKALGVKKAIGLSLQDTLDQEYRSMVGK